MDPVMDISERARLVEKLERMRAGLAEVEALAVAAHRLTDGVTLTGDVGDMADADESVGATVHLLAIAKRQLKQLGDDLDEEIERASAMCDDDDDDDNGSGGGDDGEGDVVTSGERVPPANTNRQPELPALM